MTNKIIGAFWMITGVACAGYFAEESRPSDSAVIIFCTLAIIGAIAFFLPKKHTK